MGLLPTARVGVLEVRPGGGAARPPHYRHGVRRVSYPPPTHGGERTRRLISLSSRRSRATCGRQCTRTACASGTDFAEGWLIRGRAGGSCTLPPAGGARSPA